MESSRALNDVLEMVRTLSPEERAYLRSLLGDARADVTEDAFAKRMVDRGLLERRRTSSSAASDFQPVAVNGTPTSAVIIEDRR